MPIDCDAGQRQSNLMMLQGCYLSRAARSLVCRRGRTWHTSYTTQHTTHNATPPPPLLTHTYTQRHTNTLTHSPTHSLTHSLTHSIILTQSQGIRLTLAFSLSLSLSVISHESALFCQWDLSLSLFLTHPNTPPPLHTQPIHTRSHTTAKKGCTISNGPERCRRDSNTRGMG